MSDTGGEVETLDYYSVEGLAMNDMLASAKLEKCRDKPPRYRVVAVTKEGKRVATKCDEEQIARRTLMVISLYMKWSRDVVSEEKATGVAKW